MFRFDPVNPHPVQKIIIPKGTINPGETTIIEVPGYLHNQPLVVAKRKLVKDCNDSRATYNPHPPPKLLPETNKDNGMTCVSRAIYDATSESGSLNETEQQEKRQLQKDLEEFQKARRKLLSSATKMASKSNNCDKLLHDIATSTNQF